MGVWLLYSFVIGITYKCNLKAKIIAPKLKYPFESIEEFVESPIIPMGVPDSSYDYVLRVSTNTFFSFNCDQIALKDEYFVIESER